jgi:cardiolipin synthase
MPKPNDQKDTSALKKTDKVFTAANLLTFLRIGLIPVFAIALVYQHMGWALIVFAIAGISDGIDGTLARLMKQESELGTVIDPIADKLLMTTAFIMISLPSVMGTARHLPVPFWVTATVIGRDVAIVCVATSITVMTGFRGFRPSWLGKASTFVQVVGVLLVLIAAVFTVDNGLFLPATYFVVAAFAVASCVHYKYHVARQGWDRSCAVIKS